MPDAIAVLKQILDSSAQLSTWGLAVFGGTVAAILGTSYPRPIPRRWRLPFLLFVPGWFCVAQSLYLGNAIAGRYLASTMVKEPDILMAISTRINDDYGNQADWLLYSLFCFGAWLMCYLYYWVFVDSVKKEKS